MFINKVKDYDTEKEYDWYNPDKTRPIDGNMEAGSAKPTECEGNPGNQQP